MLLELAAKIVLSVAAESEWSLSGSHPGGGLRRGNDRLLVSLGLSQVKVKVQVLISKKAFILFDGASMRQRCLLRGSFIIAIADDEERPAGCVRIVGVVSREQCRIDCLQFLVNLVVSS